MSELVVSKLRVEYGGIVGVRGIDLTVRAGTVVALVGANGAGKSSTVRAIMGLVASSGSVALDGKPLPARRPRARVVGGIGYVPEGRGIFQPLSVRENLDIGGFVRSGRERTESIDRVFDLFPVLRDRQQQMASSLSGGEQQMLAVGRALMSRPTVLILDEASMGLSPVICKTLFASLRRIADDGTAVLVADQNAHRAVDIADYLYVMRLGEVVSHGRRDMVGSVEKIARTYLGRDSRADPVG